MQIQYKNNQCLDVALFFSCIFADAATTLNCIVVVLFKRAEWCKKLHVALLLCVTMQFVDMFCHRLLAQTMSCKRHLIKILNIGKEVFDFYSLCYSSKMPFADHCGPYACTGTL